MKYSNVCSKFRFLPTLFLVLAANCGCPPERAQPSYPGAVPGWKDYYIDRIHVLGDFVLSKGESSDNGKIGITVVGIEPPKPCAHEGWLAYPNATIRFFRPPNRETLCEKTWIPGSLTLAADCKVDLGITGLYIEINSKEGWVHLQLRE